MVRMKMVLLILCILNVAMNHNRNILLSGANGQSYKEVRDVTGAFVRYGTEYSFTLSTEEGGSSPLYHFGNGKSGDPVQSDTEITMGMFQRVTQIMACVNGRVILVANTSSSYTPPNALIKVRLNSSSTSDDEDQSAGRFYRLDITQTPDVGVQIDINGRETSCTPGQLGTPFRFHNAFDSTHMHPTS